MEHKSKFRLTKLERNWILYDVGNSAFVPLSPSFSMRWLRQAG